MTINDVIRILRTAPRTGAADDVPEGTRVLTLSDTLAQQMATTLERERDQARGDDGPGIGGGW